MEKKYSEQLNRFPGQKAEGQPCEILERITFARTIAKDGRARGKPLEVSRRYDLKTGERLNRLSDDEFEVDESGERITRRS